MWENIIVSLGIALSQVIGKYCLNEIKKGEDDKKLKEIIKEMMSEFCDSSLDCEDFYNCIKNHIFIEMVEEFYVNIADGLDTDEDDEKIEGFFLKNCKNIKSVEVRSFIKIVRKTYETYLQNKVKDDPRLFSFYKLMGQNARAINYTINRQSREIKAIIEKTINSMGNHEKGDTEKALLKKDNTNSKRHFYIFSSNVEIKKAFVDGDYEKYKYDSDLKIVECETVHFKEIVQLVKELPFLFIEGNYGSGKTILSIRLQIELMKEYETHYYNVEDFADEALYSALEAADRKVFVFIDGVDKLIDTNIETKRLDYIASVIGEIHEKNNLCSFIINSRYYSAIDQTEENANRLISMNFALSLDVNKMMVIRTNGFCNNALRNSFLSNINPNRKTINSLTISSIKKWYRKAGSSYENPLFCYVIANKYYNEKNKDERIDKTKNDITISDNIIEIYGSFVEKTIKGRFIEESINGTLNESLYNKYETLLREIAVRMIHEMKREIDYSEDSSVYTLSNEEVYAVSVKKFGEEVKKHIREIINESKRDDVVLSEVVNNYFFSIFKMPGSHGMMVRFSDLNIMCYFAAIYIYNIFIEAEENSDMNEETKVKYIIEKLSLVELHPRVIDLLIYKIENLEVGGKEKLTSLLWRFIYIINHEHAYSANNIRVLLILYIVFIRTNTQSYAYFDKKDILEEFYDIGKIAKLCKVNDGSKYLLERYYRKCRFINCQTNRINYNECNFSETKLIEVDFKHCSFVKTDFEKAYIRNAFFNMCDFGCEFDSIIISGDISIKNSKITNSSFSSLQKGKDEDENSICFYRCVISDMSFIAIDSNDRFVFEECIINDLKIRRSKCLKIYVAKCTINGDIDVDVNSNVYCDQDSLFGGKAKRIKSLIESD